MLRKYDGGESVLSLSKRYDFLLSICSEQSYPPEIGRKIVSRRTLREPERKLNERDLKEFRKAEAEDRVTHVNQSETHHAADLFEKVLCDHFEENGVASEHKPSC